MTDIVKSLEEVRREIDEIDTALHELIMRRTRVVEQVAAAKGKTNTANFIPGREVIVLRRLLARHEGAFPPKALVRMWREMMSTFAAMQGPFHVAAYAEGNEQGCWDLARDYFGSHDAMTPVATPREVVARVSSGEAAIGVVPVPSAGDSDAWWRMLCGAVAPRVVVRLPFVDGSNARDNGIGAFAITCMAPTPTGEDRTLLVIEPTSELSRTGLRESVSRVDLKVLSVVSDTNEVPAHLVEVEGFVTAEDNALKQLAAGEEMSAVSVIGAYGVPAATVSDTLS